MLHIRLVRAWVTLIVGSALLTGLASCGDGDGDGGRGQESSAGVSGDLTVFAAASLTEAFTEIGRDFEKAHPNVTVDFNFAGSSTLARQLERGAPADVFAAANEDQMTTVVDEGLTKGRATVFVSNKLQIAVPKGNPADVQGLSAFEKDELKLALCAKEVPCGAAARDAFDVAGITPAPDTLEKDVKAVLTKVRLGEADAGLVYRTDVTSADGKVEGVSFPEADEAVNDYPIAVLEDAPNAAAAEAFEDHVRARRGQRVLANYGFTAEAA